MLIFSTVFSCNMCNAAGKFHGTDGRPNGFPVTEFGFFNFDGVYIGTGLTLLKCASTGRTQRRIEW
jgi:hypothetical protein